MPEFSFSVKVSNCNGCLHWVKVNTPQQKQKGIRSETFTRLNMIGIFMQVKKHKKYTNKCKSDSLWKTSGRGTAGGFCFCCLQFLSKKSTPARFLPPQRLESFLILAQIYNLHSNHLLHIFANMERN